MLFEYIAIPKTIRKRYSVKVDTYFGDADGSASFTIELNTEAEVLKVIRELTVFKCQFPHGRGGCSKYYDQNEYFNPENLFEPCEDEALIDKYLDKKHFGLLSGNFDWIQELPYDWEGEQNYSISAWEVFFYGEDGVKYRVDTSKVMVDFHKNASKICKEFMSGTKPRQMPSLEDRLKFLDAVCALVNEGL